MMEYKRLTKRADDYVFDNCCNCEYDDNPMGCTERVCYEVMKNRLAELEDKIEQGTLIELPCKVGDTVYVIPHIWDRKGRFVGEIDKRKADAFYVIGEFVDIEDDVLGEFYRMGEQVFLTREEAEKRLKELQE